MVTGTGQSITHLNGGIYITHPITDRRRENSKSLQRLLKSVLLNNMDDVRHSTHLLNGIPLRERELEDMKLGEQHGT